LIYVPHGGPTEQTITALKGHLQPRDIVADGGNSYCIVVASGKDFQCIFGPTLRCKPRIIKKLYKAGI
jgi:hypothetical protein